MDFEEAIRRGHRTGPLDAGVLRRTWPFDGLPAAELESIAADATWARYPYGAEITGPGAEGQAVFLIVRGGARVYLHSPQGYQFTGLLLSPADLIDLTGLPPALVDVAHAQATNEDVVVFRLAREAVVRTMLAHPTTARWLLDRAELRFNQLTERFIDLLFYDATTRLAHLLGRLALGDDDSVVRQTREQLGEQSGMSRVQVTRSLAWLRRRRLIRYPPKGREITVPDPQRLLALGVTPEWMSPTIQPK